MKLNELTLHPKTKTLVDSVVKRLPHALIIEGPVGVGVSTLARSIAVEVGSPEFIIYPKKKSKGTFVVDMSTGRVIIEDVRRLYMQTRTNQTHLNVYVIDTGLASMTKAAQNAFLKLLEEPRPGLHFIIATHSYDALLPTITSRCQRLSLIPLTDKQSVEFIENLRVSDALKRARLLFIGRGLPALLTHLNSNEAAYNERVAIMQDAKTILQGSQYQKLLVINKYRDERGKVLTLLDDVCHQLNTAMKTRPDKHYALAISDYIDAKASITTGGNVRLHLTAAVL